MVAHASNPSFYRTILVFNAAQQVTDRVLDQFEGSVTLLDTEDFFDPLIKLELLSKSTDLKRCLDFISTFAI